MTCLYLNPEEIFIPNQENLNCISNSFNAANVFQSHMHMVSPLKESRQFRNEQPCFSGKSTRENSPLSEIDGKQGNPLLKYKTELCKNWMFSNSCPYGKKCCYAHGKDDLRTKQHVRASYRTKRCTSFFGKGFCLYGNRCHFIHKQTSFSNPSLYQQMLKYPHVKEILTTHYQNKRLSVFTQLAQ